MVQSLLRDEPLTLAHKYGDITLDISMEPTSTPQPISGFRMKSVFYRVSDYARLRTQERALSALEHVVEGMFDSQIDGSTTVQTGLEDDLPGAVLKMQIGCRFVIGTVSEYDVQQELADTVLVPVDMFANRLLSEAVGVPVSPSRQKAQEDRRMAQLVKAVRSVLRDLGGRGA